MGRMEEVGNPVSYCKGVTSRARGLCSLNPHALSFGDVPAKTPPTNGTTKDVHQCVVQATAPFSRHAFL